MGKKKEEVKVISAQEFIEMKKQVKNMSDLIFGKSGKEPRLISDIVTAIMDRLDNKDMKNKLATIQVLVIVLIILILVVIFLMCFFNSQMMDITELEQFI